MRLDLSAIDFESTPGFLSRLAEYAETDPAGVAVALDDRQLTWQSLFARACQVANGLVELGCEPGDRVAILAGASTEYIECFLGIVSAGMCAVTIPTMVDLNATSAMLSGSRSRALFASSKVAERVAAVIAAADGLIDGGRIAYDFSAPGWCDYDPWRAGAATAQPEISLSGDAEFNIVYSSGTTGIPKGIVHSHATRASMARGFESLGFDASAITQVASPLYTNMTIPAFLGTMWGGGTTLIMSRFDAGRYLELAESRGATHFFLVPTMARRIVDHPDFGTTDLSATRLKYIGGSHVSADLKRALLERWPGDLLEVYGMTEGAPVTCFRPAEHPDKIHSVGIPAGGCDIRVVDDEGSEVPVGTTGELVGRSGGMMLGYDNLPEVTARLIWRDAHGDDFFRSGDLGRFDEDGFVYVLDRKKDMIISGGLNIYAADLEPVIAGHPAVAEVAVIAIPSERWGETPLALVVPKPGAAATKEEILAWSNERLGKYQRLGGLEFRSELPLNPMGKVLKRALRAPYWEAMRGGTTPAAPQEPATTEGGG